MQKIYGLIFILILSFWTFKPLFNKGLFPIHDDTQVVRVNQIAKALTQGHFPVRWSPDLGYGFGYPLFNFYAPLPYYFGGLIDYFLKDGILATKLMYFGGIILAGISMFILVSEFLDFLPSLLSAMLYLYAPYHAVQIYVRGAVGEYWAYGLLPLVVWGLYKISKTKNLKAVIITGFLIALIILSHNLISLIFIGFLLLFLLLFAVYLLIRKRKLQIIYSLAVSILIGLLLSSFFWLPAVFESKYTNISSITTGGSDFHDHFLNLDQLWNSPWGFGGSAPGRADGMSFKLGKLQLLFGLLGILSVYWLKFRKKINNTHFIIINFILLLFLLSLIMSLGISIFIWNQLSFILKYVQFPWRFLVFMVFSLSFIAAFSLKLLKNNFIKNFLIILFILLTVIINQKYFKPQYFLNLTNNDYLKEEYVKWTVSGISDEYLPKEFIKPTNKNQIAVEPVNNYFTISSLSEQQIILNRTAFPGWTVYLDGKIVKVESIKGLLSFIAESGTHEVVLLLKNTPVQMIGNTLTIITFLGILLSFSKYEKYHS